MLDILLVYVCLSKNFSMSTEKVAKPAQPIHAAFGPPETKSNSSKSPETQRIMRANKNLLKKSMWNVKGTKATTRLQFENQRLLPTVKKLEILRNLMEEHFDLELARPTKLVEEEDFDFVVSSVR